MPLPHEEMTMATMELDGYVARIDYDEEDNTFHGRITNIGDVVTFEGKNPGELLREFATSLKVYRDVCREDGRDAEEPFSGKFVLRVDPDVHRAIAIAAEREEKSINRWAADALERAAGE